LPGYQVGGEKMMALEVRTSMTDKQGREWIGAQNGLFQLTTNGLQAIKELAGIQIRDLVETPWGLVAATKMGVWLNSNDSWKLIYKGDAWSANMQGVELAVSVKDKGIIRSADGINWQEHKALKTAMKTMSKQAMQGRISLEKLNMDLHTGKAFFGKSAEWIWIDVIGFVLAFLSGTGIYLWWRGERRKKAALTESVH
jgi:ligand-binding sensor domain-containing protein